MNLHYRVKICPRQQNAGLDTIMYAVDHDFHGILCISIDLRTQDRRMHAQDRRMHDIRMSARDKDFY